MGRATMKFTPGLCYNLNNVESSLKLSVLAQGCHHDAEAVRFQLLPAGGYLRIGEDGRADTKGGGGGYCHFVAEQSECGLLRFSRGPYALSTVNGNVASVSTSGSSITGAALWEVEENQMPEGPPLNLVLLCMDSFKFGPFQREDLKDGIIRLKTSNAGYLRIGPQNGQVDAVGGGGPPCQFKLCLADDTRFTLRSEHEPFRCLGVNAWGALSGRDVAPEKQLFRWETLEHPLGSPLPPSVLAGSLDFDDTVDLTLEQKKRFVEDGFLIIRGAVPAPLAARALAEINGSLLKPGTLRVDEEGNKTYCTDIAGSDTILALLYGTPLWTIAQRLMGRGCVARRDGAQIALRPPNLDAMDDGENSATINPWQWHFDGMIPSKHWSPFSLLLGIALSDQSLPNSGNLIAFRGSHHILQPMVFQESQAPGTHPFLSENSTPKTMNPELQNGEQMLLGVGDAVLLHQKVAHRPGNNCSPNIRYQTYFRLAHVDHAAHISDGSVHNLWREFGGLKEVTDMVAEKEDIDMTS